MKTVHLFNPHVALGLAPVKTAGGRTLGNASNQRFRMSYDTFKPLMRELCGGSGIKDGRWMVEDMVDDSAGADASVVVDWEEAAKVHALSALDSRNKLEAAQAENAALLDLLRPHVHEADAEPIDTLRRLLGNAEGAIRSAEKPVNPYPEDHPLGPRPAAQVAHSARYNELDALTPGQVKDAGKAAGVRFVGVNRHKLILSIIAAEEKAAPIPPHA